MCFRARNSLSRTGADMTRDQWIREISTRAATWHALAGIYVALIATMVLTGMSMT